MARRGMGSAATALRRPDAGRVALADGQGSGDHSLVAALATASAEVGQVVRMVPVAQVAEHPNNPRDSLGDLGELASSISALGLRQPILVVPVDAFSAAAPDAALPTGAQWVVLAGHRRRAAAEIAGVEQVAAWVRRDLSAATDGPETFLAENVHRRALSPLEEARAMALLSDLGRSQRQIAERCGFTQSHVSKRLALLRLPQPVQDALAADEITIGDALAITGVPAGEQLAVYETAQAQGMPVTSAVGVVERERADTAARDKARTRAEREGLRFLERPAVEFGADAWAHLLAGKPDVAAARKAGVLVAGWLNRKFAYFTTAPGPIAHREVDVEEKERRGAYTARAAAARQLVARKPAARQLSAALADAVLRDRVWYADSLRLVHKWLGDSVGITDPDMYRWRDSVVASDTAAQAWVAWAMTVAAAEARIRGRHRCWDADDLAYLERLAEVAGYEPSRWEEGQIEAAVLEGDSVGITAGEED